MDSNGFNNFNNDHESNKSNSILKSLRNGIILGLSAGIIFTGTTYVGNKVLGTSTSSSIIGTSTSSSNQVAVVQTASTTSSTTTYDVATIAEELMPAMVSLNMTCVETTQAAGGYFFNNGQTYSYEYTASGSGIIFSQTEDKLYLLTNYHVVEDAKTITAEFVDGESYDATLTGYDEDHDLAVVEINLSSISDSTKSQIKVATFAAEDDLTLGEPCVAIGNALGYGQSVTVGYVSATAREVQSTDNTQTLIQTDAAINPGNSGGALINMKGEVIGVNSAKYADTDVEGMGFAIPVSTIMDIVPDLIAGSKNESKTVYLGISGATVTTSYIQAFGWPQGVYVSSISSSSPAEEAGLKAGDIITEFEGTEITEMTTLQQLIAKCSVGQQVTIKVARQQTNGSFTDVTLTAVLAERVEE